MSLRDKARSSSFAIDGLKAYALTLYRPIVAIWLFSFFIRGACAIWFSGMIDAEGAEYARIAQNLLIGVGYVGMATPGQQLFFPPLFPLFISAVTILTGDAEVAGRIISVVFGSLVVVPVYLIAQRMYSERVAVGAAALVGIHPFLVEYSTTVHCEPTYLTIILTSIYIAMRAMDRNGLSGAHRSIALHARRFLPYGIAGHPQWRTTSVFVISSPARDNIGVSPFCGSVYRLAISASGTICSRR